MKAAPRGVLQAGTSYEMAMRPSGLLPSGDTPPQLLDRDPLVAARNTAVLGKNESQFVREDIYRADQPGILEVKSSIAAPAQRPVSRDQSMADPAMIYNRRGIRQIAEKQTTHESNPRIGQQKIQRVAMVRSATRKNMQRLN